MDIQIELLGTVSNSKVTQLSLICCSLCPIGVTINGVVGVYPIAMAWVVRGFYHKLIVLSALLYAEVCLLQFHFLQSKFFSKKSKKKHLKLN
jgi:hypothetical protein